MLVVAVESLHFPLILSLVIDVCVDVCMPAAVAIPRPMGKYLMIMTVSVRLGSGYGKRGFGE